MTALSPRHLEIVTYVGRDGMSYEQVADALAISPHTVRHHVREICRRTSAERPPREQLVQLYWCEVAIAVDG